MELVSSLLFMGFIFLGIYVFFYEAVMAIIRRFQYGDPVAVGPPPPHAAAYHSAQEEMIAQIGARRREERNHELQQRLQQQFQLFEAMTQMGARGRRMGAQTRPAQPVLSPEEQERRRVVQEQDSEYQRALAVDGEARRQEQLRKQEME